MERQLVASTMRADRSFPVKSGYRVVFNGNDKKTNGETWVAKDDLDYLIETSSVFKDFIKRKMLVIKTGENNIRDENKQEEKQRLSLIDQALAMAKRVMPNKKPDSELKDNVAEVEGVINSLKTESKKELSLFKDALRRESQEWEEERTAEFTTSIEQKMKDSLESVQIEQKMKDALESVQKDMDTAAANKMKDALESVQKDMDTAAANKLKDLDTAVPEKLKLSTDAALNQFTKDIDKLLKNRLNSFEKVIKTAIQKAEKQIKP